MYKIENIERKGVGVRNLFDIYCGLYPNSTSNPERSMAISLKLYKRAKSEIKIVSGWLSSKFYNNPIILSAFEKVCKRNVRIEIICGPEIDKDTKGLFELSKKCKDGSIKIYQNKVRPKAHFSIVDGENIRIEDPHSEEIEKGVRAIVIKGALPQARELLAEFEKLRKDSILTHIP